VEHAFQALHDLQLLLPGELNSPLSQSEHSPDPSVSENFPAGQIVQALDPSKEL
jgi:hypothetical protein